MGIIDIAQRAGVLADAGSRLGFRHGLIRQALYDSMPGAVRSALHLEAARALSGAGAAVERVAAQLAAAPGTAEGWVLDWLGDAAPALIHRAPQVAADLLRDALAQLPESDPRRDKLEVRLVNVELLLFRDEAVQRDGARLLARAADPARAAELAWLVAYSLMRTGQAEQATALVRQTLARPGISQRQEARLRAIQGVNLAALGHRAEATEVATAALDLARGAGDRLAAGYALHALSCVALSRRDSAALLGYIDAALEAVADDPQAGDLRLLLMSNKIGGLSDLGREAEAVTAARQALVVAERVGTARLDTLRLYLAYRYFEAGQWDDARAEAESAALTRRATRMLGHALLALIAAYRDDLQAAAEDLAELTDAEIAQPLNGPYTDLMLRARAAAAELTGRPTDAVAALSQCLRPELASQISNRYLALPALTRLALAVGDRPMAQAAAVAAQQEADTEPLPRKMAMAGHCRGLLDGDPEPVLAAAAYAAKVGRPLDQALALEDAAALAAAAGDLALAAALARYAELGARGLLQRATARLRRYGVGRDRSGYRPRPVTGWAALTPTEIKVGELVATGMSNPDIAGALFLSRYTVQTHVSHILAKLGARSRAEIVRQALEHGRASGQAS
jgi:DNA-binding CsgD family transcriptional regulator